MATLSIDPTTASLKADTKAPRHLASIADLTPEHVAEVFNTAGAMKAAPKPWSTMLSGQSWVMLFEKPSLRTRVSFEVGITKLGGHAMYYDHSKTRIGVRESIKDYAKNLERWVDGIIARTFAHDTLTQLAEHASVPVINALTDHEHPCQALADLFTLKEALGDLGGAKLAWVGDGNNVCHSLMLLAAKLGVSMTIVTPKGFEPQFSVVKSAIADAEQTGATITLTHNLDLIAGHDAVYTDTWVSMGQEDTQSMLRHDAFGGFQVDGELMALASRGLDHASHFMHCLPAHRGEEVTDEVIDSPESLVYDQAENRMWTQNALIALLTGKS